MVLTTLENLHAELQRKHEGESVESLPDRLMARRGGLEVEAGPTSTPP